MHEIKLIEIGVLTGGGYERMNDINRRVYATNGLCPTVTTMGGGHREPKVIEPIAIDEQNKNLRTDGTVGTLTTDGSSPKHNNRVLEKNYRVRKLTPRECYRLMGFDDSDFDKAQAAGISNSQLYKQAGNSIVVNVLEAIFEEME